MAPRSTDSRCVNHSRKNGATTLLGVPICDECARAALVFVLTREGNLDAVAGNGITAPAGIDPALRSAVLPASAPSLLEQELPAASPLHDPVEVPGG